VHRDALRLNSRRRHAQRVTAVYAEVRWLAPAGRRFSSAHPASRVRRPGRESVPTLDGSAFITQRASSGSPVSCHTPCTGRPRGVRRGSRCLWVFLTHTAAKDFGNALDRDQTVTREEARAGTLVSPRLKKKLAHGWRASGQSVWGLTNSGVKRLFERLRNDSRVDAALAPVNQFERTSFVVQWPFRNREGACVDSGGAQDERVGEECAVARAGCARARKKERKKERKKRFRTRNSLCFLS